MLLTQKIKPFLALISLSIYLSAKGFVFALLLTFPIERSSAGLKCSTILNQKSTVADARGFGDWFKKTRTALLNLEARRSLVHPQHEWDLGVFESDLIHTGQELGPAGAESTANIVELNGQKYAYVRGRFTHFETGPKDVLSRLTKEEIASVSEITYSEAISLQRKSIYWGAYRGIEAKEAAQVYSAEVILNVVYLKSIEELSFNGRPVAPKSYSVVRNHQGIVVGQLMEIMQGAPLQRLIYGKSDLTVDQWLNILKQLEGQVSVLHKNGTYHGDVSGTNVIIKFNGTEPIAQLIDFRPAVFTGMEKDLDELRRWKEVPPENVIMK